MKLKILTILAILSVILLGYSIFDNTNYLEDINLNMHIQVNNYTGFNVDTDAIYFGTMPPGGSGQRDITIKNIENHSIKVTILTGGNISEWVSTIDNRFILEPNEERNTTLTVKIPKDAEYGNYTGIAKIRLKKIYG
ncbi:MAG: hypothetical protein PHU12_01310 [Candidatus Aenigmarchaeota archaeon]|nr:hypothetical protein [Candidatus Aenigmarchaeota archaeon]